jgi:Ner family transcriptional regulator
MHDRHPEDIKAAIRKKGATLASLGKKRGIDRRIMSIALTLPHRAAEEIIAEFLQVPAHEIWPSRYHPTGERLRPQPAINRQPAARFGMRGAGA